MTEERLMQAMHSSIARCRANPGLDVVTKELRIASLKAIYSRRVNNLRMFGTWRPQPKTIVASLDAEAARATRNEQRKGAQG